MRLESELLRLTLDHIIEGVIEIEDAIERSYGGWDEWMMNWRYCIMLDVFTHIIAIGQ